jgi:hypothetical protein
MKKPPSRAGSRASQPFEKNRATLWEIHPVTEIEVQQNGVWVPLDNAQ